MFTLSNEVEKCLIELYLKLWTSTSASFIDILCALQNDLNVLLVYNKALLCKPVTKKKVFLTPKSMPKGKSVRPRY